MSLALRSIRGTTGPYGTTGPGFDCTMYHLTTGIWEKKTDDFDCGEIYVAIKPTEEVIKVLSICNGSFSIPLALTFLSSYCKSDTNWEFY